MNTADFAFLEIESRLQHQLNAAKSYRSDRSVKPEGYCHNCEEEVQGEKLFCNGKCATQFERNKR